MAGVLLAAVGLGLLASRLPPLGNLAAESVFYLLAGVTIVAAAAAVTLRNALYCAVWFGVSLLGTAALLLCQGAQFLAVATIVVYAGAILVTFLFILMLAQPEGRAAYDRVSWEAPLSAITGSVIVGRLTVALGGLQGGAERILPAGPVTEADRAQGVLSPEHVAMLGSSLFGPYLIAVEAAGALLLVALVGAAVIVAHGKARQEDEG